MTSIGMNREGLFTDQASSKRSKYFSGKPTNSSLVENGFRFIQSDFTLASLKNWHNDCLADLPFIKKSFEDLLPDFSMPSKFGNRKRRFGAFRLSQKTGEFCATEQHEYIRKRSLNRLAASRRREISSLHENVRDALLIRALVSVLAAEIDDPCREWSINVHQFRVDACESLSHVSPEGMHQDGHDYVAILALGRRNVIGGMNQIASKCGNLLFRQVMLNDFDCILVDDRKVFHGVTPILPKFLGEASLDTLVINFDRADDS